MPHFWHLKMPVWKKKTAVTSVGIQAVCPAPSLQLPAPCSGPSVEHRPGCSQGRFGASMAPSLQVPSTGDLRAGFVVLDCALLPPLFLFEAGVSARRPFCQHAAPTGGVLSDTAAELSQLRDTAAPRPPGPRRKSRARTTCPRSALLCGIALAGTPGSPEPRRHVAVPGAVPAEWSTSC